MSINRANIFMLHGIKKPEKNINTDGRMQWIYEQLNTTCEVTMPFVDRSREIGYSDWKVTINKYSNTINEHSILIGHSAGAVALVRRLGETQKKINKLILVAPGYIPNPNNEYQGLKDLYDFQIDSTISNNISQGISIYTSNDDQRLLDSADIYLKKLNATHITLENRGHFNSSYGDGINKNFPELLKEIRNLTS